MQPSKKSYLVQDSRGAFHIDVSVRTHLQKRHHRRENRILRAASDRNAEEIPHRTAEILRAARYDPPRWLPGVANQLGEHVLDLLVGVQDHGRLVDEGERIHVAQRGAEFVVDAVEELSVLLAGGEKHGKAEIRERLHDVRSSE